MQTQATHAEHHHHVQRDRIGEPLEDQRSHSPRLASAQNRSAFRQAARLGGSVPPLQAVIDFEEQSLRVVS